MTTQLVKDYMTQIKDVCELSPEELTVDYVFNYAFKHSLYLITASGELKNILQINVVAIIAWGD